MAQEKDMISSPVDASIAREIQQKEAANKWQNRRHSEWDDNYTLYRNKVKINRLTQRQAVNIPLMKETIKTLMSKIDEAPVIDWKELSGNVEKEIILQEKWNSDFRSFNFEGVDIQDKKNVLLYGRGFKKLNFYDGQCRINALDIYDIVVDPLMDPLDIETARYVIHQNIFKSLRDILADPRYDKASKERLKVYLSSDEAIVQSAENKEDLEKKQERLRTMGVTSSEFESLGAGDTVLNLTEQIFHLWDKKQDKWVRYVDVYANNNIRLLHLPLIEAIGVDFYPYVTWGEDVETQDVWSDGPADIVRTPNKILNVWFSQMIENRTLKNFQMHWYDATTKNYKPQTYEPGPGRMLPAPGDPSKTIKPVEISGLGDTLLQIDFLIKMVERGTAATASQKGVSEKKQITLGEVQMMVGEANERVLGMSKFYRRSWEELAMKWYGINEANVGSNESTTLYKTSSKGVIWPKKVKAAQWISTAGYKAIAKSKEAQEEEKTKNLQVLTYVKSLMPENAALAKIIQKRSLDLIDLSVEEIREVEEAEKNIPAPIPQEQTQPQQQSPEEQQLAEGAKRLTELAT